MNMKRFVAALCAGALMLSLAACGGDRASTPTPEISGIYKEGTYPVTVAGHNGNVTVEVTFSADAITEVNVVEHNETPMISDKAISDIPKAIVDGQTLAVDAIGGATVTSKAILAAVEEAVRSAGGDVAALQTAVGGKTQGKEETLDTDVVVVGAGAAGLLAAYRLGEQGHRVVLMEKMPYPGGATNTCGGGMAVTGTQEQVAEKDHADPESHYQRVLENGGNLSDPAVSRIFAYNTGVTIDYLISEGVPITWDKESNYTTPEYSVYSAQGGGAGLVGNLETLVKGNDNISYYLSTEVTELLTDDAGAVVGVKAEGDNGTTYTVHAQAVLLATGGYSSSPELIGKTFYPEVISNSVPAISGDGIFMAQAVGAKAADLDWANPTPYGIATAEHEGTSLASQAKLTSTTGTIVVNNKGVRVMNEESSNNEQVKIYGEQDDHCLYLVMNQNGFDALHNLGRTYHVLFTPEDVDNWLAADSLYPVLVKGETAEEAGNAAGINGAALAQTVAHYNEMVAAGEDTDFGHTITEPIEGPVYILQLRLRVSKTSGGLKCDERLQILNTEDQPIAGLYGAGEVVSGSALGNTGDNLLSWCVTSGKYVADTLSDVLK